MVNRSISTFHSLLQQQCLLISRQAGINHSFPFYPSPFFIDTALFCSVGFSAISSSSPNHFTTHLHTVSTPLFISFINHLPYYHCIHMPQTNTLNSFSIISCPNPFLPNSVFVTRHIITFTLISFIASFFYFFRTFDHLFAFIYSIWTFPQHQTKKRLSLLVLSSIIGIIGIFFLVCGVAVVQLSLQTKSRPWISVLILDVLNLVSANAVLAKRHLIVVPFVKQPIGSTIRKNVQDICTNWARPIWKRPRDFVNNVCGHRRCDTPI